MINTNVNSLTKEEEIYYLQHKKLIDAIVNAYSLMEHADVQNQNGNFLTAFLTLENSLSEEFIHKLIRKKFWDYGASVEKEIANWPEWKRNLLV